MKKKIFDVIETADGFEEDAAFSGEDDGRPEVSGFEERRHDIDFYGRKPVSDGEFAIMSDGEKREELVVRFRPLCIRAAKTYACGGVNFEDLFVDAAILILEAIDRWGVDDPDIAYHIASRVRSGVSRAGKKEREVCGSLLPFEEECDDEIVDGEEIAAETLMTERICGDMKRYLDGGELETARLYFDCPDISQQEAAELLGVSQQTVSRRLGAVRRKLEPLREEYAEKTGKKRRKNFIAAYQAERRGR
ncbi:MAG: sigma-70 family RNA polymerase sigma factor [Synergistaceae bacterium]|nr:sigma-70 family RNA polymerase sigma factor [Synergistaceae bacterium]